MTCKYQKQCQKVFLVPPRYLSVIVMLFPNSSTATRHHLPGLVLVLWARPNFSSPLSWQYSPLNTTTMLKQWHELVWSKSRFALRCRTVKYRACTPNTSSVVEMQPPTAGQWQTTEGQWHHGLLQLEPCASSAIGLKTQKWAMQATAEE